jgi:uncharacterized protein YggE
MKYPILLAVFSILAGAQLSIAQQADYKTIPNIEVTGTARMDIMPDEIYVSITLRERADGKDKITVEKQDEQLKSSLQSIGIDLSNLSLSDSESDYVKISWGRKEVISVMRYTLKLSTAEEVRNVFEALDALKINDAYISKTEHSNIVALRKQLRIDAIKAAKEKADYLLEAIGEKAGHALEIRENDPNFYATRYANNIQRYMSVEEEDKDMNEALPEIGFQKIRLEASIYVKFEIAQ